MATDALSVSVSEVKRHIAFLERVHDRASSLYLNHAILSAAVTRYEEFWLPLLVAQSNDEKALVPPVDIAWVWHLHRLAPLKYAAYCRERFGAVLEPGLCAFRLQTAENLEGDGDANDCFRTRDMWACEYPTESFFFDASRPKPMSTSSLVEPIVVTADRQSSFLWQVSGASYSDESFLATAIQRYDKFLRLMGTYGYKKHFFVPSYDVDLCWHTHMLASSSKYHEETSLRAGEPVDHDDSVSDRHEGSKQYNGWANTKKLWLQTYGSGSDETAALDACGTCYRGAPPSWWFENRHNAFEVFDEPGVHHCTSDVATKSPKRQRQDTKRPCGGRGRQHSAHACGRICRRVCKVRKILKRRERALLARGAYLFEVPATVPEERNVLEKLEQRDRLRKNGRRNNAFTMRNDDLL